MAREGSSMSDTKEAIRPVVKGKLDSKRVLLVSDDLNPNDLVRRGHLNYNLKVAIEDGLDPVTAIQMVTINAAQRFNKDQDVGGIAPGRLADFVVLDNLKNFETKMVFADGALVAKDGRCVVDFKAERLPRDFHETFRVGRHISPDDFRVKAPLRSGVVRVWVIGAGPCLPTVQREDELDVVDYQILPSAERGVAKVGVVERHHATGNIGLGFVTGFGFKRGAVAQSIAHDSHNIVVLGLDDTDMAIAANRIASMNGGMVSVLGGRVLSEVHLPIAGLLHEGTVEEVARDVE